jgi:hypothetical protein
MFGVCSFTPLNRTFLFPFPFTGVHGMRCASCRTRHRHALLLIHPPHHCCMHWSIDW